MNLEFLDEVADFLDSETLLHTPRSIDLILNCGDPIPSFETRLVPPEIADSCSEDVEPESLGSSSYKYKEALSNGKRREEIGDNRRKRYRQRVKSEREELKRMEKQLSTQVQELIERREGRKTSARSDLAVSKSFWQSLAAQQREQCEQAEAEQKQLVAAVQSQATYIESLSSVVKSRAGKPTTDAAQKSMDNYMWLRLKSSDATLYEVYLKEVNDSYFRIGQVFQECCLETLPIDAASLVQYLSPNGEAECTQYVKKFVLPFSLETTSRNMWQTAKLHHHNVDREVYEAVSENGNTIAFKFRLKKTLSSGSTVSILKRALAKRFQEFNHDVIVFKIFSEGEGIFSGMDSDETAWVSMRPYSDSSTSGTLVQICSRQVPVSNIAANVNDSAVKDFQDMLHNAIKEDEQENIRLLEKLVLEDTLADIDIEL